MSSAGPDYLTRADLDRLRAAIPATAAGPREIVLLRLMAVEGLRLSDIQRALWSGVTRDEAGAPWLEFQGKLGVERRRLTEETVAALDAYRATLAQPRPEIVRGLHTDEGYNLIQDLAQDAGVRLASAHAVRATVRAADWQAGNPGREQETTP